MKGIAITVLGTAATFALLAGAVYGAMQAIQWHDPLQAVMGGSLFLACLFGLCYGAAQV